LCLSVFARCEGIATLKYANASEQQVEGFNKQWLVAPGKKRHSPFLDLHKTNCVYAIRINRSINTPCMMKGGITVRHSKYHSSDHYYLEQIG
jgi:hypothetical protein